MRFLQCGFEVNDSKMPTKSSQEELQRDFQQFFEKMFEMVTSLLDGTLKKRDLGEGITMNPAGRLAVTESTKTVLFFFPYRSFASASITSTGDNIQYAYSN